MLTDEIEIAFRRVKNLVRKKMDGESLRNETLSAIFKLNNEVGRLGRANAKMRRDLIPLQQHVNAITVGVKNSDSKMMQESVSAVEQILTNLARISEAETVQK